MTGASDWGASPQLHAPRAAAHAAGGMVAARSRDAGGRHAESGDLSTSSAGSEIEPRGRSRSGSTCDPESWKEPLSDGSNPSIGWRRKGRSHHRKSSTHESRLLDTKYVRPALPCPRTMPRPASCALMCVLALHSNPAHAPRVQQLGEELGRRCAPVPPGDEPRFERSECVPD